MRIKLSGRPRNLPPAVSIHLSCFPISVDHSCLEIPMPSIVRSILVVLLGWLVGSAVMMALHFASMLIYPLPEGVSLWDREALLAAAAAMPAGAWLLVSLAHGIGTWVGAWLAARLASRAPLIHALIIGGIFSVGGIVNLLQMRPPLWWVWPADLAMYPVAALIGFILARR